MENNENLQKSNAVTTSAKGKKPLEKVDRIIVKGATLDRLDGWLKQIEVEFMGIKLKRSELMEWLVDAQADKLSADSLKKIRDRFCDDLKLMEWALKQAKEAKADGKVFSFEYILQHIKH